MSVCVYILILAIRHEKRVFSTQHRTIMCGLSNSTIFFSFYPINGKILEKKKSIEHEVCVLIFPTILSAIFLALKLGTYL
jgi:hypothetical protein